MIFEFCNMTCIPSSRNIRWYSANPHNLSTDSHEILFPRTLFIQNPLPSSSPRGSYQLLANVPSSRGDRKALYIISQRWFKALCTCFRRPSVHREESTRGQPSKESVQQALATRQNATSQSSGDLSTSSDCTFSLPRLGYPWKTSTRFLQALSENQLLGRSSQRLHLPHM